MKKLCRKKLFLRENEKINDLLREATVIHNLQANVCGKTKYGMDLIYWIQVLIMIVI